MSNRQVFLHRHSRRPDFLTSSVLAGYSGWAHSDEPITNEDATGVKHNPVAKQDAWIAWGSLGLIGSLLLVTSTMIFWLFGAKGVVVCGSGALGLAGASYGRKENERAFGYLCLLFAAYVFFDPQPIDKPSNWRQHPFFKWCFVARDGKPNPMIEETLLSSITWSEVASFLKDESQTALQKDEHWKVQFQDKKVRWSGVVVNARGAFGGPEVEIRMAAESGGSRNIGPDVRLALEETQRQHALSLKQGDRVNFVGILDDRQSGSFLGSGSIRIRSGRLGN
jgi:hypothetical protein